MELQELYILYFNLFLQFNTLFSFLLTVCRLLDFLKHFNVKCFVLILLHQFNDIQGELAILHSNGSPGFSTQGMY